MQDEHKIELIKAATQMAIAVMEDRNGQWQHLDVPKKASVLDFFDVIYDHLASKLSDEPQTSPEQQP